MVGVVADAISLFGGGGAQNALLVEMNGKLDKVLANQELILREIQSLRLYIVNALRDQERQEAAQALLGAKNEYDVAMAIQQPVPIREDPLFQHIQDVTYHLGALDFGLFVPFACGVGMCLAILKTNKADAYALSVQKLKFRTICDTWLSENAPTSIVLEITSSANTLVNNITSLNSSKRQYDIKHDVTEEGEKECYSTTVLTIKGDYQHGFAGATAQRADGCHNSEGSHSHGGGSAGGGRAPGAFLGAHVSASEQTERLEAGTLLSQAYSRYSLPPYVPSGYSQVDDCNRRRQELLAEQARIAQLEIIRSQIQKLSTALA